jgi:hypothetical protein
VRYVFIKINYGVSKQQQLILGTGTAIWWVTEPHCLTFYGFLDSDEEKKFFKH